MADYTSPVLDGLDTREVANMPRDSAACRHCPASIWMLSGKVLTAYCQPLHVVIWSEEQRACPDHCDAQIAALASMPKKQPMPQPEPMQNLGVWEQIEPAPMHPSDALSQILGMG